MDRLVLIGGVPRSGTNLVRRIIGSHSEIAVPPAEFQFLGQYAKGKSVTEILANKRLKRWDIDLSDLCSRGHREAFICALVRYAEHVGKTIPCDKSPLNEFYYDIAQEWVNGAELKFVHMVRNPFDVMASYKHSTIRGDDRYKAYPGILAHCRNWNRSVSMGLARAHYNPQGYYLLKYEDLAIDPVRITSELCSFLGVGFEKERMLSLADYAGHRDNTSFPQEHSRQHESYAAIRQPKSEKHLLTTSELHTVSSICGELAKALGYGDGDYRSLPPERLPLGSKERLKRVVRRRILSRLPHITVAVRNRGVWNAKRH